MEITDLIEFAYVNPPQTVAFLAELEPLYGKRRAPNTVLNVPPRRGEQSIQKQDAGIWADARMRLQSKSNRNEWVLAPARGPTLPTMPDAAIDRDRNTMPADYEFTWWYLQVFAMIDWYPNQQLSRWPYKPSVLKGGRL